MKLIGRVLTSLLLFVVYLCGTAQAQVTTRVIKVKIPFEFNVGDKTFAAGDYSLTQPLQHLLVLRDARGQTIASVITNSVDNSAPSAVAKLTFGSVDGQYTLAEVWQPNESVGEHVVPSKRSVAIAKHRSAESREAAEGSQP